MATSFLPVERFRDAAAAAGVPLPGLAPELIRKYVDDLRHLGWLERD